MNVQSKSGSVPVPWESVDGIFSLYAVEQLLAKSGCAEEHYRVQECMVEHRDWRRCQHVVKVNA
jgi:hypothetical protein